MTHRPLVLDHSIVGADALTNFTVQKQYNLAGCRLCGALFQPEYYRTHPTHLPLDPQKAFEAEKEILDWRQRHNPIHTPQEHILLTLSGRSFTPEAAHRLAPYGIVALTDAVEEADPTGEIFDALREAPRAPVTDGETTLTAHRTTIRTRGRRH